MKNSDDQLNLLRLIYKNPEKAQRQLAKTLNFSLGKLNYCLKALKSKGYIKMRNFKENENKLVYRYLLTPQGLHQKTKLSISYVKKKMKEYDKLKKEFKKL